MPLLSRKKAMKVSLETTKGTLVSPATVVMVYDPQMNPGDGMTERRGGSGRIGQTSPAVNEGTGRGTCTFSTELMANGAANWDAGLIILLQACGLSLSVKTLTPTSAHASQQTISIDLWEDGLRKRLIGAMGNVTLTPDGGRVMCNFEFSGVWQLPVDESTPSITLPTATPIMWSNASNVLTLGGSNFYPSTFSFNFNNDLTPRMNGGRIEYFFISERDPVIELDPEAALVSTVARYTAFAAGTTLALSMAMQNGTDKVTLAAPVLQYREISEDDRDGAAIDSVTGSMIHSSGDDEFSMVVAAA